jgi:hypothetical protein
LPTFEDEENPVSQDKVEEGPVLERKKKIEDPVCEEKVGDEKGENEPGD